VLENFVPCLTTFSTASRKSRSVATLRRARIANIPAYYMMSRRQVFISFPNIPQWPRTATLRQSYSDISAR
jgi:hypothetical protein